jgi:hypothetical protein
MSTGFDPVGRIDAEALHDISFKGLVRDGQVYYDPWKGKSGLDKRAEIWGRVVGDADTRKKALEAQAPVFAAGNLPVMIPVYPDPQVIDTTRKETPLVELIRRIAVRGKSYDFNRITTIGNGRWRPERSTFVDPTDVLGRVTLPMKYGYAKGTVTGPAIAAMRGYIDAEAFDLDMRTKALRYLEENTIINGNISGTESEAAPYNGPNAFNGLLVSTTTNNLNLAGVAVTLPNLRTMIDNSWNQGGKVRVAVTDGATHSYIKGLLMDFQRSVGVTENIPFGIPGAFNFDGVDFIKSRFMPTASGSRAIMGIDPDAVAMAVLQDVTYQELAQTADEIPYILKVYEALAVKAEMWCSKITNIL